MPLYSFQTNNTKSLNSNPFNIENTNKNEFILENNEQSSSNKQQQLISMKDLCTEDKQRIANLIKELAK
jgi:hypothetical protein